ncbi:MAG: DUF2784 family protein [Bacteroidia bacterium]|nr:MAG: DUF2784 family protein [Bacteroidia bacterium]
MLYVLDIFFVVFHSLLIIFILSGWLIPKLRPAHLIVVLLTGASWFLLGIFYGIGYCPITDWHWKVLDELGKTGLPVSYVQYILNRLLAINISAQTADVITLAGWLFALIISLGLWIKNKIQNNQAKNLNR